jgi:hypothetical protein
MKRKNEQLHLRDYGYSIKFPKIFRIRAIRKACKVFSEEEVIEHIQKICKYHETLKEDLNNIISFRKKQKQFETLNAAYSLIEWSNELQTKEEKTPKLVKKWNMYDDGRISPVEEDVLNNTIIPLPPLSL